MSFSLRGFSDKRSSGEKGRGADKINLSEVTIPPGKRGGGDDGKNVPVGRRVTCENKLKVTRKDE